MDLRLVSDFDVLGTRWQDVRSPAAGGQDAARDSERRVRQRAGCGDATGSAEDLGVRCRAGSGARCVCVREGSVAEESVSDSGAVEVYLLFGAFLRVAFCGFTE